MQILKRLSILLVFISPFISTAQSTYLPEGSKEYHFIDRLEIKQGNILTLIILLLNPITGNPLSQKLNFLTVQARDILIHLQAVNKINGQVLILRALMNTICTVF